MSSVSEIEQAVDQLSLEEFEAFAAWFDAARARRESGAWSHESPELEVALLEGVRSPHTPYDESVLERVRQNAKARA